MVKFLNGDKKGETTVYSKSTMKRWWRKIEVINETNEELELLADSDSKEQEGTSVDIMTIKKPVVEVKKKYVPHR